MIRLSSVQLRERSSLQIVSHVKDVIETVVVVGW